MKVAVVMAVKEAVACLSVNHRGGSILVKGVTQTAMKIVYSVKACQRLIYRRFRVMLTGS